jgi:hypothetical protein
VKAEAEVCDAAAPIARLTIYARVGFFLSGVLDNFAIALFGVPFSILIHLLSATWCRLSAGE